MSRKINGKTVFRVVDDAEYDDARGKAAELNGRADACEERGDFEQASKYREDALQVLMSVHGNTGFHKEGEMKVTVPSLRED